MARPDDTMLSPACAAELIHSLLGTTAAVVEVRRLSGGTVNSVLELLTDGRPRAVVAKVCRSIGHAPFELEDRMLRWLRANTSFPVPEPYGWDLSGTHFPGSCLLMERLPGTALGHAGLTPNARESAEREVARHVAGLHSHTRETYGSALRPACEGWTRWLDRFEPRIRGAFDGVADRLSQPARRTVGGILGRLGELLPETARPSLAHNDLWRNNIIVDAPAGGAPSVTGFIDPPAHNLGAAHYVDPEYELGYLLVFNTVGHVFLEAYGRVHPLREGFGVRWRVYGLCFMMLHLGYTGMTYFSEGAEALARELDGLLP